MVGMFSLFWLRENTSAHVDALSPTHKTHTGQGGRVKNALSAADTFSGERVTLRHLEYSTDTVVQYRKIDTLVYPGTDVNYPSTFATLDR